MPKKFPMENIFQIVCYIIMIFRSK